MPEKIEIVTPEKAIERFKELADEAWDNQGTQKLDGKEKGQLYFGDCIICGEQIKIGLGILYFGEWVGRESGTVDYTGRIPVHQECFYDALRHYRKKKD